MRIYKGRYYANKEFLESGRSYRPSYAWRSIIFGRELLNKGLIRSIGDGQTTHVWSHKWIMEEVPRRPVNKEMMIDVNFKVFSLNLKEKQWDRDKLQVLFPANEVNRILQMDVWNVADRDIWAYSSNGSYTVKSGYMLATKEKETHAALLSNTHQGLLELKRTIWNVPTIRKIRSFMWRAASGALAVAERLNTRGMNLDKLCRNGAETIQHVLSECEITRKIWSLAGFQQGPVLPDSSLVSWLSSYIKLMTVESIPLSQRRAIPWLLWTIWKNQNKVLYEDSQDSLVFQVSQACEEARIWNELNLEQRDMEAMTGVLNENKKWDPPVVGLTKYNIHANWMNAN